MRIKVYRIPLYVIAILFAILFILPLFWMISTSLKDSRQLLVYPPILFPNPQTWSNYPTALEAQPLLMFAGNSLLIAIASTFGTILSNTIIAYGFARIPWKGRDIIFIIVISTLMLPFQVVMIPLFIIFTRLHWTNTWLPLIIPAFFGNPFAIFLLRQFMKGIPLELSDAARIDGASEFGILWRIIVPISFPALVAVGLFQFLGSWNDYLGPLIYLNDIGKYPVALGLALYRNTVGITDMGVLMAATLITIIPILVLFGFAQRYFVQGVTFTGLKG